MAKIWNQNGRRVAGRHFIPLFLSSLCVLPSGVLSGPLPAQDVSACSASFQGSELILRNRRIERRWSLADGQLRATSIHDLKTNTEWLAPDSAALTRGGHEGFVFSQHWQSSPVGERSLVAELLTSGSPKRGYRFRLFSDAAAVSVQRIGNREEHRSSVPVGQTAVSSSGIEVEHTAVPAVVAQPNTLDDLHLRPQHLRLTQVEFLDQTDIHNELVHERQWLLHTNESLRLQGNLFVVENVLNGSGLIFLKEAPLPHARPAAANSDFEFEAARWQLLFPEPILGVEGSSYRLTTLIYSGGAWGMTQALHEYQRQIRSYRADRDGQFLSNTWGDRSRDARINDSFLRKEIAAAARLGVDVVQVDDGWQQGRTKNSAQAGGVWNGFWAADPGFWNVNRSRFPEGLEPLIQLARTQGLGFGLWFAPDSSHDFANWERDAARLLEIYRTQGVSYFKIDGVKATSPLAEQRLALFFDHVLTESHGQVVFDLDVTAEIRPGYFGEMSVGPLFVENRYSDRHSYWPHQTLRHLWSLARYIDPLRLRVEFLNQARNTQLYAGDPLAPAEYSPAYLFASTMMANPLGWFEVSALPAHYFDQLAPLVRRWKQERPAMHEGQIWPIGQMPDGASWTGFVSIGRTSQDSHPHDSYLLVFRERNGESHWSTPLPLLRDTSANLELLAGTGTGSIHQGRIEVSIPQELGFAWFRIRHHP